MSKENTAKETLKNTGLVGSSRLLIILIAIVRTKIVAILLGPAGMGLIELFMGTVSLLQSVFGLGLGFSGVKDISEKINLEDKTKTSRTLVSLRRWSIFAGLIGMIFTILFSKQISIWTFGEDEHSLEIALLSIYILFTNIAVGYTAFIQGARRMGDFARIGIVMALLILFINVPIFYFLREQGIVLTIIIMGVIGLLVNVFYAKKIKIPKVNISFRDSYFDGLAMVKLGVFTVLTGFISQATLHYVRISIENRLGLEEIGFYAVATTLVVKYMGIIFSAMGADYFPKLSAINKDDTKVNKMIIEQTKIVLLLGVPLIIGMYTFSEFIIIFMYSEEFKGALPLLTWMLLAVFLQLIGFPIGFVFLAKGKGKIFIFTQSLWNILFLGFVFLSWRLGGGLEGVGVSFVVAYISGVLVNITIIKRLTAFSYDKESLFLIFIMLLITISYFLSSYFLVGWTVFSLKLGTFLVILYFCMRKLDEIADINIIKMISQKIRPKK